MLPSLIYIALTLLGLCVVFSKHGEERTYNGWDSLISTSLVLLLLYWGGFFDKLIAAL